MTPQEKIADLIALCEKATERGVSLTSAHIVSPGYTHLANLCFTLRNGDPGGCLAMTSIAWSDWLAAISNAAPVLLPLLAAALELEAARREPESAVTEREVKAGIAFDAALAAAEREMGGADAE
jgi:hypothetical protein